MKLFRKIYPLILSAFVLVVVASCTEEDRDTTFIEQVALPSNLALNVVLTNDNSGVVTLTPSGESVTTFTLQFGDGSEPEIIQPSESSVHTYTEGTFTVTLLGTNLNGETTSITQDVVVSFLPPENLEVTITPVSGDAFSISVSATADFAVGFEVYFGDVTNEAPTSLMVGGSVEHTYAEIGTYTVRVVALAGGAATIETTQEVVIENPIVLPIDFESDSIEYSFGDFGGAITTLITNPDMNGENTSQNVAEFVKEVGAEVFAGTVIELGAPIDFSEFQAFSLKSWSPLVGATVKLKLENGTDGSISAEIDAVTTVGSEWEILNFDFSGADLSQDYSKVIVFFDFGNVGAGDTFYFDDIEQSTGSNTGGGDGAEFPIDFEDTEIDYMIFGFEGANSALDANPDTSGINGSATVVRTEKTVGAQFFAGTVVPLATPIDFSSTEMVSIKTYSPKANIPVKLRLENEDNSVGIEIDVNTTTIDEWETLVYDFSGLTAGTDFVRVVVFFEFIVDLPGDGSVYYFDDIELAN